jgi:hypothetical protein
VTSFRGQLDRRYRGRAAMRPDDAAGRRLHIEPDLDVLTSQSD